MGKTYVEKVLGGPKGSIVFVRPDIVLSHDNTSSIEMIFNKMGGEKVNNSDQLMIVLDHNAPPTTCKLANDYQQIRNFVKTQGISRFHDAGEGICHQLMAQYARPGMIIVGSDSHTCTAGAFNAFAAGIDRTETAGLWKSGETWLRVPESIKINLTGSLPQGVYAKDIALYIIGMLGSNGANYMSVEYHGTGVGNLSIADRMTITNLASEMGAKNAVFASDDILDDFLEDKLDGTWADTDAEYFAEYDINLSELFPLVACPHHVDNIKSVSEVAGTTVHQALIGTCTNGRVEDLREASAVLMDRKIPKGFQLLVTPASRRIYQQAMNEGLIDIFLEAGANVLSPSCGPCLGTGQGIPADGMNIISTANRNFLGRMGNKSSSVYLASPVTVALSALHGEIRNPSLGAENTKFQHRKPEMLKYEIPQGEIRRMEGIWNYSDVDNLNTDQMFAGSLTYEISSAEPEKIKPHLFKGFDDAFAEHVTEGDIIICGDNFGCGSSREHPAVGLVNAGVKVVIAKSVSRIFFRSAVNQGLPVIVLPDAVNVFNPGNKVEILLDKGIVKVNNKAFMFPAFPEKITSILNKGGLVKWIRAKDKANKPEHA
jgi:homoaconitate hydratase family protein/3-isopropylmalate dehydratase small subunit